MDYLQFTMLERRRDFDSVRLLQLKNKKDLLHAIVQKDTVDLDVSWQFLCLGFKIKSVCLVFAIRLRKMYIKICVFQPSYRISAYK